MKAAAILQKRTFEHMKKNPANLDGTIDKESLSCPIISLITFFRRLLVGCKANKLGEAVDTNIEILLKSFCSSVMFNIKSDRQASYIP